MILDIEIVFIHGDRALSYIYEKNVFYHIDIVSFIIGRKYKK